MTLKLGHLTHYIFLSTLIFVLRLQEALQRNAELALAPVSGYSASGVSGGGGNGETLALSSRSNSTTTLQVIYDVHNGDKRPAALVCC